MPGDIQPCRQTGDGELYRAVRRTGQRIAAGEGVLQTARGKAGKLQHSGLRLKGAVHGAEGKAAVARFSKGVKPVFKKTEVDIQSILGSGRLKPAPAQASRPVPAAARC